MTAATFNFLVSLVEDVVYDINYTATSTPVAIVNCVVDGYLKSIDQEISQ